MGVKWIGTEGWVWVDRGGFDASNPAWKEGKYLPRELRKVKLYTSSNHQQNFLDCVRTRESTLHLWKLDITRLFQDTFV